MNKQIFELAKKENKPFYIFDTNRLYDRIDRIKSFLSEDTGICYAVKANTFIIKEIYPKVDRMEICSPGEAGICNKLGIDSECQVISGIYKTPDFIESIFRSGNFEGIFTVESVEQFRLLDELSEKYKKQTKILLRLTNNSQFGMDKETIEKLISELIASDSLLHLVGLQYFSGTQKTSIKKYERELAMLDDFIDELKERYSYVPEELEYGTGFPVAYFEGESFDEDEFFTRFAALLRNLRYKGKIILEIGRSISASCGYYFTNIVDVKSNKGQNYIITDGGMHHITYYGQSMAMKRPVISILGTKTPSDGKTWNICGSLCTMNDLMAKEIPLGDVNMGDTLCFENAGAYCMTEGIALFLSRDLPGVFILDKEGTILKVRSGFETEKLNCPNY